jgi:hypothetical protein
MITEEKIRTGAGPRWDRINHSPTYTSPLAILCPFNHLRAGDGSTRAVMLNHLRHLLSLQPSPVPRPIARITTWCHNALVGASIPRERPRRLLSTLLRSAGNQSVRLGV